MEFLITFYGLSQDFLLSAIFLVFLNISQHVSFALIVFILELDWPGTYCQVPTARYLLSGTCYQIPAVRYLLARYLLARYLVPRYLLARYLSARYMVPAGPIGRNWAVTCC